MTGKGLFCAFYELLWDGQFEDFNFFVYTIVKAAHNLRLMSSTQPSNPSFRNVETENGEKSILSLSLASAVRKTFVWVLRKAHSAKG